MKQAIYQFKNHLIVFPRWSFQAIQLDKSLQIVGKRIADGYLCQLLMYAQNAEELPDFCVCSLDDEERKWVEFREVNALLQVGRDKLLYQRSFLDGCQNVVTAGLLISFLRCYSSVEIERV